MGRKSHEILMPIFAVVSFIIIVIIMLYLPQAYPNEDWATMRTDFIQLMPWTLMVILGFASLAKILSNRPNTAYVYTGLAGALIGIGFAMLMHDFYTLGIFLDEFITGSITITDLQIVVLFICTFIGTILGIER